MTAEKYTQDLTVVMDPRVKAPVADLQRQFDLSQQVYEDLHLLNQLAEKVAAARVELKARHNATVEDAAKVAEVLKALDQLEGEEGGGRRRRGPHIENISGVRGSLLQVLGTLQEVDRAPTEPAVQAVAQVHQSTIKVQAGWQSIADQNLAPLKGGQ